MTQALLSFAQLGASYLTNAYPILLLFIFWGLCRGRVKLQLFFFCACTATIAAFFVPSVYDDLFRAFERLNLVRNLGWNNLSFLYIESTYFESGILYYGLIWLLSFFPDWFMPVSITLAIYLLVGTLTLRIAKNTTLSPGKTRDILLIVFLMINLYSVISSWRYMLALAILAHLLYSDLVLRKHRILCWCGYFALGYLHMIAFTILTLRLLVLLFRGKSAWIGAGLIASWRLLGNVMLQAFRLLPSGTLTIELTRRLESYLNLVESGQVFYHIALFVFLIALLYWVLSCRRGRMRDQAKGSYHAMDTFVFFTMALILGSVGSINMVFRYSHLLMMLLPVYFAEFFTQHKESAGIRIYPQEFGTLISCVVLIVFYSAKQYMYLA
jgi:hypothetical protein